MKEVRGNLITLTLQGRFGVIAHGCNCMCVMRAGIARAIASAWPAVADADKATDHASEAKLGTIMIVPILAGKHRVFVVNAYTQFSYGRDKHHVDYDAVRSAFKAIKREFGGRRIGYPRIGAGLGGGEWAQIAAIIDEELAGEDHTLVTLTRPIHST